MRTLVILTFVLCGCGDTTTGGSSLTSSGDGLAPELIVEGPPLKQYVRSQLMIALKAIAKQAPITATTCSLNAAPLADSASIPDKFTALVDSTQFVDGIYRLDCETIDAQKRRGRLQHDFHIDNTPPQPRWLANGQLVDDATHVGGDVALQIEFDETAPLQLIQATSSLPALVPYLGGGTSLSTYAATIPTEALFGTQPTAMPLAVLAVDAAGNQNSDSLQLVADNSGPQLQLKVPAGNSVVYGDVVLEVIAVSPLSLETFEAHLVLNGTTVALSDTDGDQYRFYAHFASDAYPDQTATLVAQAVDEAGHIGTLSAPLRLNNNVFDTTTHLNAGHGLFGDSALDQAQNYLLVSDLSNDGNPDVVFGRYESSSYPSKLYALLSPLGAALGLTSNLYNFMNNYAGIRSTPSWGQGRSVISCDFNGDGSRDLLWVHNQTSGDFTTFFNFSYGPMLPTGAFAAQQFYEWDEGPPAILTCADIDDDGRAEVLYRNKVYDVITNLSRSLGDYTIAGPMGDLNGDGKIDLAVIDNITKNFQIVFGPVPQQGPLLFSPVYARNPFPDDDKAYIEPAGDLNDDGFADLLLPDYLGAQPTAAANAVRIFWGNGSTALPMSYVVVEHPLAAQGHRFFDDQVRGAKAGDFNGDGIGDIVVFARRLSDQAQELTLLLGPALAFGGNLPAPLSLDPNSARFGYVLASADFDHNGRDELLALVRNAYPTNEGEIVLYRDQVPLP